MVGILVVGNVSHDTNKFSVATNSRKPVAFNIVGDVEFFTGLLYNFRDFRVVSMIQSWEQMMFNLIIHSSPKLGDDFIDNTIPERVISSTSYLFGKNIIKIKITVLGLKKKENT